MKDDIKDVIKETAIKSRGVIGALFVICNVLLNNGFNLGFNLLVIDDKPLGFIFNCFILCVFLTILYALIIFFVAFVPRLAGILVRKAGSLVRILRNVTFTI